MNSSPLQFLRGSLLYYSLVFDLVVIDQVSKFFVEKNLTGEKSIEVIKDVLTLHSSHNAAIAFSIPIPGRLVAFITPVLLAALIYFVVKSCDISYKTTKIALALLIAGTLGNFIDRIMHGYVVDFIDFSFFPSFNVADACLTLGVLVLMVAYKFIAKPQEAELN